jgi:hypothetical protein
MSEYFISKDNLPLLKSDNSLERGEQSQLRTGSSKYIINPLI